MYIFRIIGLFHLYKIVTLNTGKNKNTLERKLYAAIISNFKP